MNLSHMENCVPDRIVEISTQAGGGSTAFSMMKVRDLQASTLNLLPSAALNEC